MTICSTKKIAFITTGNPNNRKGFFNNVQERAIRLLNADIKDFDINFYIIRHRDSLLFSLIRREKRMVIQPTVMVDHIRYKSLWIQHNFIDYLLTEKIKVRGLSDKKYINKHRIDLKGCDLILAHGPDANYLAYSVNQMQGTPYIASWHGSDINMMPEINKKTRALFKKIIEAAALNLFVSKRLLETSHNITRAANKEVLYTGPADSFVKQSPEKIEITKEKHKAQGKQIVGFIGNLISIKNIKSLPLIFKQIADYKPDIQFWIIGDGELEVSLRKGLGQTSAQCTFFGKVVPSQIPDLINCMNIIVLPSLNEGLPRITLEALACRVPVIGSNVGGIPEVIGLENVFELDSNFENNISKRAIEILRKNEPAKPFPEEFSWDNAIVKLERVIRDVMDKQATEND